MITGAFIQKLLSSTAVTALVGNRIQPNVIKPNTPLPAIYVFSDRMEKLACFNPGGTRTGAVEIGVHSKSYEQSYAVMQAIRAALDEFSGVVNNVAIVITSGNEITDQYDELGETHIKVIEYTAIAEPKNIINI